MVEVRLGILFDYYGDLLTERQQAFFKDYYFDNLTLQEIADNNGISRNAVHKTLGVISQKLEYYEKTLALMKKAERIRELTQDLSADKKRELEDLI